MERYTLDTHSLLWYFAESSSQAIPELHDRIIAATALLTSSTLISKDQAITSSGLVKTIW